MPARHFDTAVTRAVKNASAPAERNAGNIADNSPMPGTVAWAGGAEVALLQLQRAHGNRYVQQVVERARRPAGTTPAIGTPGSGTELTLGAVHDRDEREADRIAARVAGAMRQSAGGSDRARADRARADRARATRPTGIQRWASAAGGTVDADTRRLVQQARGRGRPIPAEVRAGLERSLGADLDGVRLHTDARADELNRRLQARAFTTGPDIFFRRGRYRPGNPAGQMLLAHELTHVVQQQGRGAGQPGSGPRAGVIQRWYQPDQSGPRPFTGHPPVSGKQPSGLRWQQNDRAPKNVYRFVDVLGQGWESSGPDTKFVKSSWNLTTKKKKKRIRKKKTWWFDVTENRWRSDAQPDTYRTALPQERPDLGDFPQHGYDSALDVPVRVKMKYRRKSYSGPSGSMPKWPRPPELRAEDRIARVMYRALDPEKSSPHLAAIPVQGKLWISGNTGQRHVKKTEQARAKELLKEARNPKKPLPSDRRARKDVIKIRALESGDYAAQHATSAPSLEKITDALKLPSRWENVAVSGGGGAEHGELTLLGKLLEDMRKSPGDPKEPVPVHLGGVKRACAACWLALDVFNRYLAGPLGYHVTVSGTHGIYFPGWRIPSYIWNNPKAKAALLKSKLPPDWSFDLKNAKLVHKGKVVYPSGLTQIPEESDSEWEEVSD